MTQYRYIKIPVEGRPEPLDSNATDLPALQAIVGGYIEAISGAFQ